MDVSIATDISKDPASQTLVEFLQRKQHFLRIQDANLYYNFPLYRDEEEGGLISTKVMLASKHRGVFIFGTSEATDSASNLLQADCDTLDHVYSHVYARLLKNRKLRKSKQEIAVNTVAVLYAPNLTREPPDWDSTDTELVYTDRQVENAIAGGTEEVDEGLWSEIVSTLEGAKGLIRPGKRVVEQLAPKAKGRLAAQVEAEITTFDRRQKSGSLITFDGPQRVRGLAGSGKTVVLAMKAALTHLREPQAKILYTFWTRSLYQHVRRLITRFYRQFNEVDPDWDRLHVMHGWGGSALPGVYSVAAKANGLHALRFEEAAAHDRQQPFRYACSELLKQPIKPLYDYIFIDEGQDYPKSFVQLCAKLVEDDRFVIAYDELQNIFQTESPSAKDIFGVGEDGKAKRDFSNDVVLHKCYRNPREVLVCAHALGFGIYSNQIVQMLENRAHWEDIGYTVVRGTFTEGSPTVIERPIENSLRSISEQQTINELVIQKSFATVDEELAWVTTSIVTDLEDGLRPEDILVVTVDDRNAKLYLGRLQSALIFEHQISVNNIHGVFGESDFQRDGAVTLSTVHKAKGNEAFMVYVVGVDALFPKPTVRQRNMLFAAMTRAKGWLRVTGLSPGADMCISEIKAAKAKFPRLEFVYPDAEQMKVMRRDLEASASRRLKAERLLEQVAGDMSREEIEDLLRQLSSTAGKATKKGKKAPKGGK